MTAIRAIVLDFDGVLVESNPEKARAFEDLFGLYPEHRDAMLSHHLVNVSRPRLEKFQHYVYDVMGRPGDTAMVQRVLDQFSGFVVPRVVAAPDVPGARPFLEEFSRRVPLYLASVTPEGELRAIVRARGLDPFFTAVFGDPPLTKSEAVRAVLEMEKLPGSEVLLVGDSPSDYEVARTAGLQFVGRDSGLPWDGVAVELHRDLYRVAEVVRGRLGAG